MWIRVYYTEYTFRESSSRIAATISRPSITTPVSRPVPTSTSVSIPVPIPSPIPASSVSRPIVSAAREVNVTPILSLRGCQSLLQRRGSVSWRIPGKPFSSALDHNPDFAIAPFVLWHCPVLDIPEEVILVLFRHRPRIQGLHSLPFLLPPLFSDINGD